MYTWIYYNFFVCVNTKKLQLLKLYNLPLSFWYLTFVAVIAINRCPNIYPTMKFSKLTYQGEQLLLLQCSVRQNNALLRIITLIRLFCFNLLFTNKYPVLYAVEILYLPCCNDAFVFASTNEMTKLIIFIRKIMVDASTLNFEQKLNCIYWKEIPIK